MENLVIVLQAANGKAPAWLGILPWVAIFAVFYFFMIRPQQKKVKDQKKFVDEIQKGDTVVTIGGIHGKIASIEDDQTIMLEVDKGFRIKIEKASISVESTKRVQTVK